MSQKVLQHLGRRYERYQVLPFLLKRCRADGRHAKRCSSSRLGQGAPLLGAAKQRGASINTGWRQSASDLLGWRRSQLEGGCFERRT